MPRTQRQHPDGVVANYLQEMARGVFGDSLERRVLLNFRVTSAVLLVMLSMAVVDIALAEDTAAMRVPWRIILSSSSCFASQVIMDRQQLAAAALRELAAVAAVLETSGSPAFKLALAALVRRLRALWRFYVAYTAVTLLGTVYTMVAEGQRSAVTRWTRSVSMALRWARLGHDAFAMLASVIAFYRVLHLVLLLHRVSSALFEELGRRFQARGGPVQLRRCCRLHGRLLQAWRLARALSGRLLPVYLVVPLLLPLCSSAEVMAFGLRAADVVSLSTSPLIAISFVPQCLAGQRLQDASEAVALRAYCGPWLSEAVPERRCRMLVVMPRPQRMPLPGLRQLSRPTCLRVLRTWFQYVQILLNSSAL